MELNAFLKNNKAVHTVISAILIFAIIAVTVFATYFWGVPRIDKTKDIAYIESMKANMRSVDNAIRTVSHEGNGSKRIILIHITKGRFLTSDLNDTIVYEIETPAKVVEPGIDVYEGRLLITAEMSPRSQYLTRLTLNYTDIDIRGGNYSVGKGYYNISIENLGVAGTKPVVDVVL